MKKEILEIICIAIIAYSICGALIFATYWAMEKAPTHIEKTTCYDRFGNEILQLECGEIVHDTLLGDFFDNPLGVMIPMLMFLFVTLGLIVRTFN